MEEICQSIILGIVQGLTEFLPISSSAHLNVFPWIFNWNDLSEGMDVALHLGTLLALAIFFFKDYVLFSLTNSYRDLEEFYNVSILLKYSFPVVLYKS